MHPFGLSRDALEYLSPSPPPPRAGQEAAAWFDAERAETVGVEIPEGPDDFELSIARWLAYVPRECWPFVAAWAAVIAGLRRKPVSAATLKRLRGMMRRDVDESAAMLLGSGPDVYAAWRDWYPAWIAAQIAEQERLEPLFLLPAEEYRRRKLAQTARRDTEKKQAQRDRALGAALYAHIREHGGMVRWRPGLLADRMSSRSRGRRVTTNQVRLSAAALIRLDVAHWKRAPSGKAWAIELRAELPELRLKH